MDLLDWQDFLLKQRDLKNVKATGNLEEKFDKIYGILRAKMVQDLPQNQKEYILTAIYGQIWSESGILPEPSAHPAISSVLEQWVPVPDDPLLIEEYRRLEAVLPYKRRTLCLDLEGLVVNHHLANEKLCLAVQDLRKRHAAVITSAAPAEYVKEVLSKNNLSQLFPLYFTDLAEPKGKKYLPVAQHFGYSFPEKHLVAIGHEAADTPADINIPFLNLEVSQKKHPEALKAGLDFIEHQKESANFRIIETAANQYTIK